MFRYSITNKLMLLYYLVALSSLSAIGFYSYFKTKNTFIEKIYDELRLVNSVKIRNITSLGLSGKMKSPTTATESSDSSNLPFRDITETPWYSPIRTVLNHDDIRSDQTQSIHSYCLIGDCLIGRDSAYQNILFTDRDSINNGNPGSAYKYQGLSVNPSVPEKVVFGVRESFMPGETILWVYSEAESDLALMRVTSLRNDLLFIGVLIMIMIISIAEVITRLIIHPIRLLTRTAAQIGQGQYGTTIPVTQDNEFGMLATTFNRMSEQIEKNTADLIEREERLNHFYKATSEGILFYQHNRFLLANDAFMRMSGYSFDVLETKWVSEVILCGPLDSEPITGFEDIPHEYEAVRSDGTHFPVEVRCGMMDFHNRKVNVMLVRDITHRKTIETHLQKEREERLLGLFDGQERERQRIARELHDGLGQLLIALKLKLESQSSGITAETAEEFKYNLYKAIQEVKNISNDLAPAGLRSFGLEAALKNLAQEIHSQSGIEVEFSSHGQFEQTPEKTKVFIYRIAQEALTNALKHSCATHIHIHLTGTHDHLIAIIEDNGMGFEVNEDSIKKGNGLYNMKERSMLLGGTLDLESVIGTGTTVRVKVPR